MWHVWKFQTTSTEGSGLSNRPLDHYCGSGGVRHALATPYRLPDSCLTSAGQQNTSLCAAVCVGIQRRLSGLSQFDARELTTSTSGPPVLRSVETPRSDPPAAADKPPDIHDASFTHN